MAEYSDLRDFIRPGCPYREPEQRVLLRILTWRPGLSQDWSFAGSFVSSIWASVGRFSALGDYSLGSLRGSRIRSKV